MTTVDVKKYFIYDWQQYGQISTFKRNSENAACVHGQVSTEKK